MAVTSEDIMPVLGFEMASQECTMGYMPPEYIAPSGWEKASSPYYVSRSPVGEERLRVNVNYNREGAFICEFYGFVVLSLFRLRPWVMFRRKDLFTDIKPR